MHTITESSDEEENTRRSYSSLKCFPKVATDHMSNFLDELVNRNARMVSSLSYTTRAHESSLKSSRLEDLILGDSDSDDSQPLTNIPYSNQIESSNDIYKTQTRNHNEEGVVPHKIGPSRISNKKPNDFVGINVHRCDSHTKSRSNDSILNESNDDWMDSYTSSNTSTHKNFLNSSSSTRNISGKNTPDVLSSITSPALNKNSISKIPPKYHTTPGDDDNLVDSTDYYHEERPTLNHDEFQPKQPFHLEGKANVQDSQIPGSATRYLKDYQLEGVQWCWEKYCKTNGCILGDDMGLGKTVQVICFLLAVMHKTGSAGIDLKRNRLKHKHGANTNMAPSPLTSTSTSAAPHPPHHTQIPHPPSLIICPRSVMDNWTNELKTWGYFLINRLDGKLAEKSLEQAREWKTDVILGTYDGLIKYELELSKIEWDVVVFDEGHCLSKHDSRRHQAAMRLSRAKFRIILSGTPIQNRLEELWGLITVITNGNFHTRKQFVEYFSKPIKRGASSAAVEEAMELGEKRQLELQQEIFNKYVLKRYKDDVLADVLLGKDDIIVFCELSPLQTALYKHILSLPEFDNARYAATPCPCGSLKKRSACCRSHYRIPYKRAADGGAEGSRTNNRTDYCEEVDSRAVVWRRSHAGDLPCDKCPGCVSLACMQMLSKVASHPALLQASSSGGTRGELGEETDSSAIRFLEEALTPELVNWLGGRRRSNQILRSCQIEPSGKMVTLDKLLSRFTKKYEKSLVFSQYTRTLDIIEDYVKSKGWSYLRLDGSTQNDKRQNLVDKFNQNKQILVFLLSTKAAGLGLNLVSASKVIIFDCNWNPSLDKQAQDRAYRFGQTRHVSVYRLIAQGTVEELSYMRQLYKQILQEAVYGGPNDSATSEVTPLSRPSHRPRRFEGIEGDQSCRGELFGMENLLQHEENGSILSKLRSKYSIHTTEEATSSGTKSSIAKENNDVSTIHEKDALRLLDCAARDAQRAEGLLGFMREEMLPEEAVTTKKTSVTIDRYQKKTSTSSTKVIQKNTPDSSSAISEPSPVQEVPCLAPDLDRAKENDDQNGVPIQKSNWKRKLPENLTTAKTKNRRIGDASSSGTSNIKIYIPTY